MFACGKTVSELKSFDSSIKANAIAEKILAQIGLPAKFEVRTADIDDNVALARVSPDFKKLIYLNEKVVDRINLSDSRDNYEDIFIIAHEIGHHLSTNNVDFVESRLESELIADEFAGYVLNKLGGSIKDILVVFGSVSKLGCETHPPRNERIFAGMRGWNKAEEQKKQELEKNKPNEASLEKSKTDDANLTQQHKPVPVKPKECEKKNTGDYCFKNNTTYPLKVSMYFSHSTDGPYQMTLKGGESKCFYDLKADTYGYEAIYHSLTLEPHPMFSSSGQIKVEACQSKTVMIEP